MGAGKERANGVYELDDNATMSSKSVGGKSVYRNAHTNYQIFADSREWNLSTSKSMKLCYTATVKSNDDVPPRDGWKSHYGVGTAPMPILEFLFSSPDDVRRQLVLRKLFQMQPSALPPKDVEGWFADPISEAAISAMSDPLLVRYLDEYIAKKLKRVKRRRLTSEAAGYRSPPADGCESRSKVWSHDHTATRRHIRLLLESEAAGHA